MGGIDMIIVFTSAYNAAKTLSRAVDSILSQTYVDFVYYLLDNGSTDKTGDIITKYAIRDSRIIPLKNKVNGTGHGTISTIKLATENYSDGNYFITLDADDEYKTDFLEKMLSFMDVNNLDIAACGNDFIDAKTGRLTSVRVLPQNLVLNDKITFDINFAVYHQFMRTVWGKIYSLSVLRKCTFEQTKQKLGYGTDTLIVMEAFLYANRVGIFSESLHKYYVSPKSVSHSYFNSKRIMSDRVLHETAINYLKEKVGFVSPPNLDFLLIVYMNALNDTLKVLLNAKIDLPEKISGLHDMFTSEYTKQLAAKTDLGVFLGYPLKFQQQRKELFAKVAQYLLAYGKVPQHITEKFCEVGELVCTMTENTNGWRFFKKYRARFFLREKRIDEARAELSDLAEFLSNDKEIIALQSELGELN
jgi:glycosyltransferase involved in cell wall biosynthesis